MKKITFIFLAFIFCLSSFGQTNVEFNFNGQTYRQSSFEVKNYIHNDAEATVYVSEKKPPNPDLLGDGVVYKLGFRMILTIENHQSVVPVVKGNPLTISYSSTQRGMDEYAAVEKKANSGTFTSEQAKAKELAATVEAKQAKIKELSEKVGKGDMKAMAELEKLLNEQLDELEEKDIGNVDLDATFDSENDPFYSLTFFLPYNENLLEYEVNMFSGKVKISALNEKTLEMTFSGTGEMYFDERDTENRNKSTKEGLKGYGLKEKGPISGTLNIKLK